MLDNDKMIRFLLPVEDAKKLEEEAGGSALITSVEGERGNCS